MQLHQNPSLKGTLVENKTGSLSCSTKTAVIKTTAEPLWVHRQSGDGTDFITQELEMVSTSTTIPLTELLTIDDKMIDWNQMEGSVFPTGFESLGEDSVRENPPMGTLNAAIFDAELDLSMGMGDEVQLPSFGAVSTPQSMTGMMNNVLPSERPISPSEFLNKPAPSSLQQLQGCSISPDLEKMIEEVLPHTSPSLNWDASQVDLNLFNPHEPDAVDCLEWDISEVKEDSRLHLEEKLDIMPTAITQQDIPVSLPPKPQRNSVGPVRVRRERRCSKKPARFRDVIYLDEDVGTQVTDMVSMRHEPEEAIASESSMVATKRGNYLKDMSNEEKYIRSRKQNNLASKRCREKRKANLEKMSDELKTLEERNKVLSDKVDKLTALRDEFQKFVNNFLFQRMMRR